MLTGAPEFQEKKYLSQQCVFRLIVTYISQIMQVTVIVTIEYE